MTGEKDKPEPQRKNSGRKKSQEQVAAGDQKGETASAKRKSRFSGVRPRISIEELRNAFKRQASIPQDDAESVFDPMAKAQESRDITRGKTGVVYDERMAVHQCLWDPDYPECPERLLHSLNRCRELGLLSRCEKLVPLEVTEQDIMQLHTRSHLDLLRYTKGEKDLEKLEELSSHYDAIYIHPDTYDIALLAVGSTLALVDGIASGKVQNGMALIRPPGHHAMKAEYCGYCFFNNVALAAQHALEKHKMSRIMIVDWDVHHGQGTQQMFYEDPRVLYFSIHRYEQGSFWPELRQSDYDYLGSGQGRGFNFNLPLNKTGMKNEDYLAIFHQVLLPVAYEFAPELVLVSSGYDSALGDEKGEMLVTPAFYAHLTSSLMALAQGRVAVVLEGGYCLESTAEGAARTLGALLGDSSPPLMDPISVPCQSLRESILNLIYVQRPYWRCFQYQTSFSLHEELSAPKHVPSVTYIGTEAKPVVFETRNCYPKQSTDVVKENMRLLKKFKDFETTPQSPKFKLCLVYDEEMCKHRNVSEKEHPERPERTERIWQYLKEFGLTQRALILKSRRATRQEIETVHTADHINLMFNLDTLKEEELQSLQETYKSVYLHPCSNDAALLSAGSLLQVVDSVCSGESQSGIGVVRPPGHHAEVDHPHGFCLYNNVAVAAKYAIEKYNYKRILILDWDVHHGNGIQHVFEDDPRVLYISIHRYDYGLFFPSSEDANYDRVGTGKGEGFNVNIPWNKSGMGDGDYMSAMLQVVMPVAYQYNPQLVLVSAGFDAARGDPLGGCRVSPECYGHMTHLLTSLSKGRVILALEGGYNLNVISYCMTMCAKALLGDPLPLLNKALVPSKQGVETVSAVIKTHSQYWSCLCFQVALPIEDVLSQSCGGMPIAVESGLSGSEISSCHSSPMSTPSGGSPMYVSAPSSPEKAFKEPKLMNVGQKTFSTACEAEICVGVGGSSSPSVDNKELLDKDAVDSEKSLNALNSSSEYTTPTSTPKMKPSVKSQNESAAANKNVRKKGDNTANPTRSSRSHSRGSNFLMAAAASSSIIKKPTAIINTEENTFAQKIFQRCQELELLQTCKTLCVREAADAEISAVYEGEDVLHISSDNEKIVLDSSKSYISKAVGCTFDLISEVVSSQCQNGMVIINLSEGSCSDDALRSWNIVELGAKYSVSNMKLSRVMIVDLDAGQKSSHHHVCCGQKILRFSFHNHKNCSSKDRQTSTNCCDKCDSNFDINVDCHAVSFEDYLAIYHQIILPIGYEFSPELVIVSCAYKEIGHCKNMHPVLYTSLVGLLMGLAEGRVIILSKILDGNEAAVEGVSATLSALQDIPCSLSTVHLDSPSPHVRAEILSIIASKRNAWKSLQYHAQTSCAFSSSARPNVSSADVCSKGKNQSIEKLERSLPDKKCMNALCLVYDESMMEHFSYDDQTHPESPDRIKCIYDRLDEFELVERCLRVECRQALVSELEDLHTPKHLRMMTSLSSKKPSELLSLQENYDSVYLHRQTNAASLTAVGSVVAVVDSVMKGESLRGLAVVRPPGHHAERNEPCGFCFYNNVAVAAKHAINTYGLKRVLILDWDVHHGNGIQHMFESEPRVLYISIHRYDNGRFFPCSTDANYNRVGTKRGKGYTINIPWNKGGMGDGDYMAAMTEVVMPVGFQFKPQLVLVSAGFDAAAGDPLGGCQVTPECYGHMTKLLMQLAEGKVVIALEGGYNLGSISYCMAMCAKALLGDPIISLSKGLVASQIAVDTLTNVISTHKKYWSALDLKCTTSTGESYTLPPPLSSKFHISETNRGSKKQSPANVMDDLSANLSGVTLDDKSRLQTTSETVKGERESVLDVSSSENADPKGINPSSKEDCTDGAVGGAVGVSGNINTFLLSEQSDVEQMYAVVPLNWCPHLEQVEGVPATGLDPTQPCETCQDRSENWICLTCYKVFCGRYVNEHMLLHGVTSQHYIVLSLSDLSVWCYACESYIHHSTLHQVKRAAHIAKFGEDIPDST